jgi:hypothetical protein
MKLYIVILVVFFMLMLFIAYVFSEVVMCYYQDLPVDDYSLKGIHSNFNPKLDERIKQVWVFTYVPSSHNILEFGFGNTTATLNLNKRLHTSCTHLVIIPKQQRKHQRLLAINKKITHTNFLTTFEIPILDDPLKVFKTIIVHLDGQHMFWDLIKANVDILKTAKVLVLEMEPSLMSGLKPVLQLYNFKKQRTHVYLSIWYKQNMSETIKEDEIE